MIHHAKLLGSIQLSRSQGVETRSKTFGKLERSLEQGMALASTMPSRRRAEGQLFICICGFVERNAAF